MDNGQRVWTDIGEWLWGWRKWSFYLGETILISYVGTLSGAVLAFALNFLAAENTSPAPWLRFVVKRLMEFCRTVPDIVFALIFVIAFGLGPMAGVLAITIHTIGALGKLFSEIVENIDMKPVEGVRSHRRGLDRPACGSRCCRRWRRALPAIRCCASRSMCAAPR